MKPKSYLLIFIFVFYSFFGFSQGYVTSQQKQNFKNEVKFDMPPSAPNATKPFDLVNLQLLNQTIQNAIINSGSGTVNFVGLTTPAGLNVSIPQITTTGTFNITFANGYSLPTNAMQANWNTAFGWGNPAGLYKPISYVPIWSEITSNPFLFSSPLDNQILKYSTSSGKWLNWTPTFEPGISGGTVTQYWRGDKTWQTLPTSLPASDVYAWAKASVKPTYTYSEVGAAPSSTVSFPGFGTTNVLAAAGNDSRILNGQTAFEWGNHASAGYVTGTPWTSMGYITGITSGNVTTALGFTPYNATNPAGYTSNLGTVTSVGSGLGLTGTVTTSGTLALDTANVTVLSRQRASNTYQLKGNYVTGTPWTSMGYLTSISSGNVTTALGFTPYNSTNPNGYNTGTVTSITKGLGMIAGTISTSGSVALDTTDVTVLSRQRAANTYQTKGSFVPTTRTVNTLALSSNIVLTPDNLDDAATAHKFVSASDIINWNGKGTGTVSSLTTNYDYGAATLVGGVLNIPNYGVNGTTWSGIIGGSSAPVGNTTIGTGTSVQWIYTDATPSVYTLPDAATNSNRSIFFKNRGSSTLTIQRAGTDNIYDNSLVTSIVLNPGESRLLMSAFNIWNVYEKPNTGTVTNISTGLGLSGGPISTSGTVLLDTANVTVLSRQRAANTYQVKLLSATNIKTINGTSVLGSGDISTTGSMIYPSVGIPLSTGSAWSTSITNNSANWNTAFGWGNHASAGYVTGTPWTGMGYITGITSGNVTTALGFTPYNATNPNGYTSNLGTVTSVGSGLGLTGSVSTSGNLALDTTNVTVLSRQRASNTYQTKLGFTPYNATNPSGYISSITSGNVTTALGFTPYNATNPAGYTSNLGTVTSVGSGLGLTGSVTTSGNLALDTTNVTVLSRQRAANTYQTKLGFTPYNSTNPNGYNTGTVTSITKGLGMVAGTISTTGSVALDTTDVTVLSRQRAANTYQVKLISASNIKTINGTTILGSGDITTSGSMVYPGVGIPLSTGSAWGTSITNNSANWNSAYTNTLHWDGSSTGLTAATGRTSLGLGTAAQNATGDFAPVAHVGSSGASHAAVTTSVNGFMIAADKSKLDGIAAGATANVGTVTSTSVASANGFAGTVVTATTTPAITISTSITGLIKGNGTAISAAGAGTDYLTPSGSAASLTSFPTFNQNTTGYAANLSGGVGGQILYQSASNTTSKLGNGTAGQILQSQGTTLSPIWADNTGSGANAAGTYIVKTATNAPANAQILASLSTGLVKNTTSTGVLSIAIPRTDYLAPSDTLPISNYINGANTLASGKIAVLRGDSSVVTLSGGSTGQAVIKQADGTVAFGTVSGVTRSYVSCTADRSTSSTTLVDIPDLSLSLAASSTYYVEFGLMVAVSADVNGAGFGINLSSVTGATIAGVLSGSCAANRTTTQRLNTFNTGGNDFFLIASQTGGITFRGLITTGTTAPTLTVKFLHGPSAGTTTVNLGSFVIATKF
jgi:hypothetical protein